MLKKSVFPVANFFKCGKITAMTAEEFYKKIMASPDLQQALEDATDNGSIADFLTANGCSASPDEFSSYISEHS